ncbi:hypothetical protein G6F65_017321 [Rhizopus arrhizus]|nr:hypothetical protein G6F65_017321 [Rhizopus arrhizus]
MSWAIRRKDSPNSFRANSRRRVQASSADASGAGSAHSRPTAAQSALSWASPVIWAAPLMRWASTPSPVQSRFACNVRTCRMSWALTVLKACANSWMRAGSAAVKSTSMRNRCAWRSERVGEGVSRGRDVWRMQSHCAA